MRSTDLKNLWKSPSALLFVHCPSVSFSLRCCTCTEFDAGVLFRSGSAAYFVLSLVFTKQERKTNGTIGKLQWKSYLWHEAGIAKYMWSSVGGVDRREVCAAQVFGHGPQRQRTAAIIRDPAWQHYKTRAGRLARRVSVLLVTCVTKFLFVGRVSVSFNSALRRSGKVPFLCVRIRLQRHLGFTTKVTFFFLAVLWLRHELSTRCRLAFWCNKVRIVRGIPIGACSGGVSTWRGLVSMLHRNIVCRRVASRCHLASLSIHFILFLKVKKTNKCCGTFGWIHVAANQTAKSDLKRSYFLSPQIGKRQNM